jgi:surface polysaccharide O-acyltransferase-like enzyme
VNQTYFMSAFFRLAGYVTPSVLQRKDAGKFFVDRLIRLGIPILIYTTLIINLNQVLWGVWLRGRPFRWMLMYEPGHLWFLQALLLFALVYVLYRMATSRVPAKEGSPKYIDRFPPDRALITTIILLAALTFVARIAVPVGGWSYGFQLGHFVHYIFSFFVGILAYRDNWFSRIGRRQAVRWGVVALVMLPIFFLAMGFGGALEGDAGLARFMGGLHWQSFAYSTWESIMFIAVTPFLLYFFREWLNGTSPLLRRMAASVFTVYIIHQTLLFALHTLFMPVGIPTMFKFLIVALVAVPSCFGLALLIRRIPYAKQVLG